MADVTSFVGPMCECFNAAGLPAMAAREADSFFRLNKNLGSLEKAAEVLGAIKELVEANVEVERTKLNECDPEVKLWLKRVDKLLLSVDAIDKENNRLAASSCLCCYGPNIAGRHRLGKRVTEMVEDVKMLIKEGKQFKTFGFKPPPDLVEERPSTEMFGNERLLRQLHDLFDEDDSNIIGVWGPGGVGKTTLLNVFNNDLKAKAGDYQVVIVIEVSNSETLNTVEIQQTISERVGLHWKDTETEERRAKFLVKVLAKKRFVVLLDDVRKKFRLEDVGIPTPDAKSKSKLVLTSRSRDVCNQMGAHKSLIEMQLLDRDAAWNLFRSNLSTDAIAAIDSPAPDNVVKKHAMAIAEQCRGLPLALNVIGRSVAGLTEPREWSSAMNAIDANMAGMDGVDDMFAQLKYSYDMLERKQQQCFLYCTLFPEYGSISKEQLVDYWLAEGLIQHDCDKGYQIIRNLISACLLLCSSTLSSKVKMHHVIRHLGLWLMEQAQEKFVVQPGMALESAPVKGWKEAKKISLMSNNIKGIPFSPRCTNLTTLLLQNNQNLDMLGPEFFKYMSSLRVLDLSHTAIRELPDCDALVALQHLNLSHTNIVRLPERFWVLRELRHLDLSVTVALEDTFDNCSKLHKLKVLNLFRSHYGIREVDNLNLDSLKELMFLGITIYAEDVLKKLSKTHPLARSTFRLNLKYCAEMQSIQISDLNHMKHLEELYVESCYNLNELVADADLARASCLQVLTLAVLPSLETVILAPVPHHFRILRKLVISHCHKLQNVTWVLTLESLERLVISHCDGMEQVVQDERNGARNLQRLNGVSEEQEIHAMVEEACNEWRNGHQGMHKSDVINAVMPIDFPKLKSMVLIDLKKLTSICNPRDFLCLESIRVEDCPNLKRIPLSGTYGCGKLKQICGSYDWWEKLEWEDKEMEADMENKYFIPI